MLILTSTYSVTLSDITIFVRYFEKFSIFFQKAVKQRGVQEGPYEAS